MDIFNDNVILSLQLRSEIIATYALCGFANVGAIGIQLGGLTPMAPNRKGDFADVAVRALIAGTVACFMTACIAGRILGYCIQCFVSTITIMVKITCASYT